MLTSRIFTAVLAVAVLFGALQATAQPIAHWTFDEGLNDYSVLTEMDAAGGGADAVFQNMDGDGLRYAAGVIGGAAVLDGLANSDHYYDIASIAAMDGAIQLSISAWIQPTSQGGYKGIVMTRDLESSDGTGQNWGIARENNSRIDGRTGAGGGLDSADDIIADGSWYHVAFVWDADEDNFNVEPFRQLYINGQLVSEEKPYSSSAFDVVTSGLWSIGRDFCCPPGVGNDRQFGGGIDDIAVFDVALTASEVTTLYSNGLNGIDAAGTNTGVLVPGDVDGLNGVDIVDFELIRDNFQTDVTARNMGDLTGDAFVDLSDFSEWYQNAPSSVAALADWTVPEPSAFLLLSLAALLGLGCRRAGRSTLVAVLVVCGLGLSTSPGAWAQGVTLIVDRDTSNVSIANTSAIDLDIDGYAILSDLGALNPTTWFSLEDQLVPDWREAGIPSINFLSELKSAGTSSLGVPLTLGAAFDPLAAKLAAGFSVDVEDLQFDHHSPNTGTTTNGFVEYVGEKIYNNLVVNVDLDSGNATIENESPFTVSLNGYTITSPGGFLDPTWTGIRASDSAWQAANPTVNQLSELRPTPGTGLVLAPEATVALGHIYTGAAVDADLTFDFTLADVAEPYTGILKYEGGVNGDFNGDDLWDCMDINALTAAVATMSTDLSFDMNGDGTINLGDITDADVGWLAVGGAANPVATDGNAFLEGDATLDGAVDVSDFNAWNGTKFTPTAEWCSGDFNADGSVDVSDFNIWNMNKFKTSAGGTFAVPEPASMFGVLCGVGVLLSFWKRS